MASTILAVALLDPAAAAAATAQQSPETHQKELLAEILDNLGFKELARGIHSLYQFSPYPVTIFASSDDLLRRSRDSPLLLSDVYLVPGLHSAADLARLPNSTSKEAADSPSRNALRRNGGRAPPDQWHVDRAPGLFCNAKIAVHGITEPFSADYHWGFIPISLDEFVKFIYAFVIATTLVKLLVLRLADELNRMRRRAGGDGRGPHLPQD